MRQTIVMFIPTKNVVSGMWEMGVMKLGAMITTTVIGIIIVRLAITKKEKKLCHGHITKWDIPERKLVVCLV